METIVQGTFVVTTQIPAQGCLTEARALGICSNCPEPQVWVVQAELMKLQVGFSITSSFMETNFVVKLPPPLSEKGHREESRHWQNLPF